MWLEKTAYILRCLHWLSRKMTFEKRARRFYTINALLPRSGSRFWSVVARGKFTSTNQEHYPDLVSDASSVWIFCTRFSDVNSRGNKWGRLFRQASLMLFKCIKRENSFFFVFQGQKNPAKIASEHIDLDIRKNNQSVNLTTVNATWSIEAWGKTRPAFFK